MSSEYAGCGKTSQPNSNILVRVKKDVCGLALSWWKTTAFRLARCRRFVELLPVIYQLTAVHLRINVPVTRKHFIIKWSLPNPPYGKHHFSLVHFRFRCWFRWFSLLLPGSLPRDILIHDRLFITCNNLFLKGTSVITFK